ncbi:MAG TPA: SUMF1/EgtB/PvdO family nonheme iron enzyme, partial [Gemmataceae bacterium]|nr:SUMF1/EgtB/PvdO family nonheme iron enzyme [Gemmataceae bacterium]
MMPRRKELALYLAAAAFALLGCDRTGAPGGPKVNTAPPVITTKGGIAAALIPAGFFEMGSRRGREEEQPLHKVWIDSFLMDRHEVTQAEYTKLGDLEAFPNPAHFKAPDLPVEQVTWPQAARFCNARSRLEGLKPCYNEDTGE